MGAPLDIAGQKFGEWTVISRAYTTPKEGWFWICQCSCGALDTVNGSTLRRGKCIRCPACRFRAQTEDLTGRTIGEWTVLGRAPSVNGATMWHVRCSCGTTAIRNGQTMKRSQAPGGQGKGSSRCNECGKRARSATMKAKVGKAA